MHTVECKIKRTVNVDELRELVLLMEDQETTDRYTSTSIEINGDFAKITVDVDADGNVTLN